MGEPVILLPPGIATGPGDPRPAELIDGNRWAEVVARLPATPPERRIDGHVLAGGRWIVRDGHHVEIDVAAELDRTIAALAA